MEKQKRGQSNVEFDSEAWNIADGYTKLKILKQLVLLDSFEMIAQHGIENIDERYFLNENEIKKRRIDGLIRYRSVFRQVLGNVLFSIKSKDRDYLNYMIKRTENLEDYIGECFDSKEDLVNHEENFTIYEEKFKYIFKTIQDLKDQLNFALDRANLIFKSSQEIDLDKIMDEIVEGG